MALIDCPECDHSISDQATACPHCGLPLADPLPVAPVAPAVQTIEQTGKPYKAAALIGGFVIALGFIAFFLADDPNTHIAGAVLLGLGLVTWLVGRIGAWWDHG